MASEEAICGAGLIVLQRAAIAVEDIGGLLHALRNDDPQAGARADYRGGGEIWPALTNVTVPDIRATFVRAVADPNRAMGAFRLPPDSALHAEGVSKTFFEAARRLRELTADRWRRMLVDIARFWLDYGDAAKATMHGFTAIAGRRFREPPGPGWLGRGVSIGPGPCVVLVNSTVRGREVQTPRTVLTLDQRRVGQFCSTGVRAAKLAGELSGALAHGIETGHAYGVPDLQGHLLSRSDRQILKAHVAEATEDHVA
jgi:hypothetical protein